MFTGLVEETGRVEAVNRRVDCVRIRISASQVLEGTRVGDSIAVQGVCLTVTRVEPSGFESEVVPETAARTNLSRLRPGARVNLERSLEVGARLGGHLVLGHVDGRVTVLGSEGATAGERSLWVRCPQDLMRMVAAKGSVALDGVSLTVAALDGATFSVALIPHTLATTTLGGAKVGDELNLEVDVLARYAARQLDGGVRVDSRLTEDWLEREGYR